MQSTYIYYKPWVDTFKTNLHQPGEWNFGTCWYNDIGFPIWPEWLPGLLAVHWHSGGYLARGLIAGDAETLKWGDRRPIYYICAPLISYWNKWLCFLPVGILISVLGNQNEEIETIRLPVKDPKAQRGVAVESFPILHPHRVLTYLFDDVGITIPEEDVRRYWQHAKSVQEPFAINAPDTCTDSHIPIGIHGDAARLWTQVTFEKLVGITMNLTLFRPKSVRHSRFMLFTIPVAKLYKNRTLNYVWERLCWSFDAAFAGYNPEKGPRGSRLVGRHLARAGQPLTKGFHKFCVTEYRGDWEWHRDVWRPYASWQATKVCFKCPAVVSGDPGPSYLYHNTGGPNEGECQWVREEFSLQTFIARSLREKNLCHLARFLNAIFFRHVLFFCDRKVLRTRNKKKKVKNCYL